MSPGPRSPDTCEFRATCSPASDSAACRLVARITGEDIADCRVSHSACNACCQYPLPAGPRLNPIVASLAFASADRLIERTPDQSLDRVGIHQARSFATRWLAREEETHRIVPSEVPTGETSPVNNAGRDTDNLRIGLAGATTGFGLAHLNRDLARHLEIDRWLTRDEGRPMPDLPCRFDSVARDISPLEIEAWLDGLDVVVFAEAPTYTHLVPVARQLGVRVVCIPMWEWLHPGQEWLDGVDLMLCPTVYAKEFVTGWQARFHYQWDVAAVAWPIDVMSFEFRKRRVCRSFVYIHGSGGMRALRADGSPAGFQRKGCDVLVEAARRVPHIPIIVYAHERDVSRPPPNIQLRRPPTSNSRLYVEGDVCIQPSRWEGLGLPLLECQAAGLPLIAPDAPPMNEHSPFETIPVARMQPVFLGPDHCIHSAVIDPAALADTMATVFETDITAASHQARHFIEHQHNWESRGPQIRAALSNETHN